MEEVKTSRSQLLAYILPMVVFLTLLALIAGVKNPNGGFWLSAPAYWIFPVQTLVCGGLLWWFRGEYEFQPARRFIFSLAVATIVFLLWISPQAFLHFGRRVEGFNPAIFAVGSPAYWASLILRFARLVLVVPIVEEVFWRGFLLRYLIREDFSRVPFGTFSWLSFIVVTVAFALGHAMADWPAALITGGLYNLVAYRTKSLLSCALTHGITNLLLGLWIMQTGQWGFW